MYEAKVTVTTKGRKSDLPVKNGDVISVIRTTNCPKGKWLARDNSNNCECRMPSVINIVQRYAFSNWNMLHYRLSVRKLGSFLLLYCCICFVCIIHIDSENRIYRNLLGKGALICCRH